MLGYYLYAKLWDTTGIKTYKIVQLLNCRFFCTAQQSNENIAVERKDCNGRDKNCSFLTYPLPPTAYKYLCILFKANGSLKGSTSSYQH
jgi:hypothetical protein